MHLRETLDTPRDGVPSIPSPSYSLSLHFGDIVVLEASIHNYEETNSLVPVRPMERSSIVVKELLLKLGSAFLELFHNQYEMDTNVGVVFTEDELWVMRQAVNIGAAYRGVPLGLELKRKIYEGLVAINSSDGDATPAISKSNKADTLEKMMAWKKETDG